MSSTNFTFHLVFCTSFQVYRVNLDQLAPRVLRVQRGQKVPKVNFMSAKVFTYFIETVLLCFVSCPFVSFF